jgi:hypothetical protein
MGSYGSGGGWPFEYGGGPSSAEKLHAALRSMMGNAPGPEGGIEDLWRRSKARAIDLAASLVEHAVAQSFPQTATTGIPRWEVLLSLVGAGYDEERRQAIILELTRESRGDVPTIEDELQAFHPTLTVLAVPHAKSRVQQIGRIFEAWGSANRPIPVGLFGDEALWRIRYGFAPGETLIPKRIVRGVDAIMQERMSAWETYQLTDDGSEFNMDGGLDGTSHMDQTRLQ